NPQTRETTERFGRDARFPINYVKSKPFDVRAALITGINAVETEWMIQLDDDDFLVPGRLEADARLLASLAPTVVSLEHDFLRVDYNRKTTWVHALDPAKLTLESALCLDNFGPQAAATFRTKALTQHNPYQNREGLLDYDLRASLLVHGTAHGVNSPGFIMDDTKLPERLTSSKTHMISSVLLHAERYRKVAWDKKLDLGHIEGRIAAHAAFYCGKIIGLRGLFGEFGSFARRRPFDWLKGMLAHTRDALPDTISKLSPPIRGSRTYSFAQFAQMEPDLFRLIEAYYLPAATPK
ncbi:MAG: glycosyltransferase family 2 protein, partial [Verrucomicrobia bacterium]|nr:glycosyltransferase family 2 protein [Verrucomicrobiota bacterium]